MTPVLEFVIAFIGLLLTNGIFFYSINRKLKKAEVADKEVEILKKLDDEWLELYRELKARNAELEERIIKLRDEKDELTRRNGILELKNQNLNWYRCNVNNCPKRQPPHVFDIDGIELEAK